MPADNEVSGRHSGSEDAVYRHRHWPDEQKSAETAERQTASLAGIVIVLLLLVGGLFLVQQLRRSTSIEDCLLAGRANCDALVAGRY